MKLTTKIVILLFIFWFFLLCGYISIFNWVIKPALSQFEKDLAIDNLERFRKTLERELINLNRTCADYSWWDDTYEFVIDKNENYKRTNLLPQTYEENKINMILIINKSGEIVYGEWFDLTSNEMKNLPVEFSIPKIALTHPLLNFENPKSGRYGIIATSYGNVAISSNQILTSKLEGESHGVFIMGKLLDNHFWESIRNQTILDFEIYPYNEKEKYLGNISLSEYEGMFIQEDKNYKLYIWDVIHDIYKKPLLLVILKHNQNILRASENMQFRGIMGFLIIMVIGIISLWIAIRKQVILPLLDLTQNIRNSTYRESITFIPHTEKGDEISLLIVQFNRMAYRINKLLEEKTKLLKEIVEREEYLKFIINAVPCVILEIDKDGIIKTINSAIENITGLKVEEVKDKKITDVLPVKSIVEFVKKIQESEDKINSLEVEDILYTTKEEKKYLHIYFQKNDNWENASYIGVIWDITALREIQEKYNEQRQLAILGEASASLAHELRNMISSIQSGFQLLQKETNLNQREEITNELYQSISRLEETLKKLLEFTKKYQLNKVKVSIRDIIEDQYQQCILNNDKNITLETDGEMFIEVDINLFSRAIWNILKNAIESISEKGTIWIKISEEVENCIIEIKDNGTGIEEKLLDKVGTPFFTTKSQGTGLGLSITKKIIESHGGKILIKSKKNEGTCVTIVIPK